MAESDIRQCALAHLDLGTRARDDTGKADAGVLLCERTGRGQVIVRGDADDPTFVEAVRAAVGVALPTRPNTVATSGRASTRVLWLGPDEWLLAEERAAALAMAEALEQTLTDRHAAVVDLGDAHTVIGLAGARAREVLMKGTPLDVHPRTFPPGSCAGTSLALTQIILDHLSAAGDAGFSAYDIYVQRSYATYLWAWLEDAAREYGLKVVDG
jgi:sarcosine oxidase subunit gamma